MKTMMKAGALLALGALLAGCSSTSTTTTTASDSVTTTCDGEILGIDTTAVLEAASEDSDISNAIINITIPGTMFGLEGDLDPEELEEAGIYENLAEMFDMDEDDMKVSFNGNEMIVSISSSDADQISSLLGLENGIQFSSVVSELEDAGVMTCE